jgi:hypothetical protein
MSRMVSSWIPARKAALFFLAASVAANAFVPFFGPVAFPAAPARAPLTRRLPGSDPEDSSCRCQRCAGPSTCPCDHGVSPAGSACTNSREDRSESPPETAPPAPAKLMCEVPPGAVAPELWSPRVDLIQADFTSPFPKPVDKVPISPV